MEVGGSKSEKQRYVRNSEAAHLGADDLYVVDVIVRHVDYGRRLRYMVRRYDSSKAGYTSKPPHDIQQYVIDGYWHCLDYLTK